MAYTITEKILSDHTDKKSIKAGEFIWAKVDFTLGNDITAPIAIEEFEKFGFHGVSVGLALFCGCETSLNIKSVALSPASNPLPFNESTPPSMVDAVEVE